MSSFVRAAVVLFALSLMACPAEEAAGGTGGAAGQPIAGMAAGAAGMIGTGGFSGMVATGGIGGASGMVATGGVGGVAGMLGTGGASGMTGTGGMMADAGVTDAMVSAGHPDCAPGYDCRNPGGQFVCVNEGTGLPLACTMGGTECTVIPGSVCGMGPAGMQCLKSCGEATAAGCPMGLMCGDPFAAGPFCSVGGAALPPTCTMGGTECATYGLTCLTVMGIMGCWMNCTL